MEIKFDDQNEKLLVSLKGELDEYTAEYVRLTLDSLLKEQLITNVNMLVLDFSQISFMDSTGIGVLLGRYNKFNKYDISMCIKNPQRHVDRILKMTGIYEIMPKIS